ncbi:MAG: hypothetical protein A2X49_02270 [Lentisphaerae bacterium GWF2_52_8]|nr:MAG: hypothetical protein A2X49_02270 [Lentisphaerae bacterium GWF2_52_8]
MSTKYSNANFLVLNSLKAKIEEKLHKCATLEEAAQNFLSVLYDEFAASTILIRLFATVRFKNLPAQNQDFVSALAKAKGVFPLINEKTPVLSLLGSRGRMAKWNDRRKSAGHVGIPLVSKDFLDSIPMMSRLLKELGVEINWIDAGDTKIVVKTRGNAAGVFFVLDATSAEDSQGRKIISAQDFVEEYNIKTVFGFGGEYGVCDTFITTIIFTDETIDKSQAEQFMFLINMFKSATTSLALKGRIFA